AGACVTASNVPEPALLACAEPAARLAPPADATVVMTTEGVGAIECDPHCGDDAVTRIEGIERLTGETGELVWFCLGDLHVPAGVAIQATGSAAAAIVVLGDASLAGALDASGGDAGELSAGRAGPGG